MVFTTNKCLMLSNGKTGSEAYEHDELQVFRVKGVEGMRLNSITKSVEWYVRFEKNNEISWEPNHLSGEYSKCIFDFLSRNAVFQNGGIYHDSFAGESGKEAYEHNDKRKYVVKSVSGLRLNATTEMLEWAVEFKYSRDISWQPNHLSFDYSESIYDFLFSTGFFKVYHGE